MDADLMNLALRERVCDASDRIPTNKWPFYSTTLKAVIAEGDTATDENDLVFTAQRDTLFTDLSVQVSDEDDAGLEADISLEYCNVDLIEHTDVEEYFYCCARKPLFIVGVKENKSLHFSVELLAAAPSGGAFVSVTLSGYQGIGCCP